MEKTLADKVTDTFMDCLYREEEVADLKEGEVPEGVVRVEGIVSKFGFHPGRLESHRAEVKAYLEEMPPEFHKATGGGWSFLNLCMTKGGEHWAEHPTMEKLIALGIGLKMASFLLPREMWDAMPGSVPYVQFDTSVGA